jgi:hypothetical protein
MPAFQSGVHQRRRVLLAQPPSTFRPRYIITPLKPGDITVPLPAEPIDDPRPHVADAHRLEAWPVLNTPSFTWVGSAYVMRF